MISHSPLTQTKLTNTNHKNSKIGDTSSLHTLSSQIPIVKTKKLVMQV
jgi:hypothetical protein